AGAKIADGTAQGDVRFPLGEIAEVLAVIELDHDLGMPFVQFAEHRREQDHEDFLRRNPDDAARVTLLGRGCLGKSGCREIDLPGAIQQAFARGRQRISGLALVEQGKADRPSSAATRRATVVWLTCSFLPAARVLPSRATARK